MKQAYGISGGALAAALPGMLFCIWTALGNEVAFCVTAGCSLYQDLVIGGLSMWWIGTAAFGVLACLALALGAYFTVYTDADIYTNRTANNSFINPWSDVEVYVSKGTVYSFVYSVQEMFPDPPEGYGEQEARAALAQYEAADIPEGEKVAVVGIMLEAFCDLTDYPVLADIPAVAEVYVTPHVMALFM